MPIPSATVTAHFRRFRHLLWLIPIGVCAYTGIDKAQSARGWLAFTARDYPEALAQFQRANDASGQGMVYLALRQPAKAEAAFTAQNDQRGLGLVAHQRRLFDVALRHFQAAGDQSGAGLALLSQHRLLESEKAFVDASDWSGLGLVALARRDTVEARRRFTTVQDRRGLGLVALQEGKYVEALAEFKAAGDDHGMFLLALHFGQLDAAEALAIRLNDESLRGMCALSRGQLEQAEAHFRAANDWNGMGDVYSAQRDFARAREAFARDGNSLKVIQSFRNDWTLGDEDRLEQAITYGKRAVQGGVLVADCLCEMADVYYEMGENEQALASLDQAARMPGAASEAALRRGRIFFYLRDYEKARAAFASVKAGEVSELAWQVAAESLATLDHYRGLNLPPAPSF